MITSSSVVAVRTVPHGYDTGAFSLRHLEHSKRAGIFIKRYAKVMDTRGGDALLGLLGPAVDIGLGVIHSGVTVYRSYQVNLPQSTMIKIIARHAIDVVIGFVPVVGDLLDFGVRSNLYAQEQFAKHHDIIVQILIEQGADLTAAQKQSSRGPSERSQHRSIESIRAKIEPHLHTFFSSKTK